jgi:hypothetical protein
MRDLERTFSFFKPNGLASSNHGISGLWGTRFFKPNGILRISAGRLILLFTKEVDDFE